MSYRSYIAIDLKSFYASVECVERGLDPLAINLVVADGERTDKTICLAVSPTLKARGVPGRPRLFEVVAKVKSINSERKKSAPYGRLSGSSYFDAELNENSALALDYIVAPPRMALYIKYSTRIYGIYLKYFAPEDIHVYSVDEVFIDATHYLKSYKCSAKELAKRVIGDVFATTGITATAGIGTNMYLAKVAMDIVAKRKEPDANGSRIAVLDEHGYREQLWEHKPITDFWRVGKGYSGKLEYYGIYTMGDVAMMSVYNDELLYKLFGVNAELLIDHAWGWEPCGISDVKEYKPSSNGYSTGQVLQCPYEYSKAKLVTREMCELLVLDLVSKGVVTNQMVLTVGYDTLSLEQDGVEYKGEVTVDYYGRAVPKHAHGTVNLSSYTSSGKEIVSAVMALYEGIVDEKLLVRRINITANNLADESKRYAMKKNEQLDMFTDYTLIEKEEKCKEIEYMREKRRQKAVILLKNKFGKNSVMLGMNLEEGATAVSRNMQIGGHKA